MQGLEVLLHIEFLFGVCTTALVLDGGEEGAQAINLYSLTLQQHLHQTTAELLQYSKHHVGGINTSVLADVGSQLAGVHGFYSLAMGKPLAIDRCFLVLVLSQLIKNLCHNVCNFND